MDKVTIIPKESKNTEIFSKNVRDVTASNDFFAEHIMATRKYMSINDIPVSGKRYSDIGNVLLKGSVLVETSIIDALYVPMTLDDRQYQLLLSYCDKVESEGKLVAAHTIYKDNNDNKYKFNIFSVNSKEEYEKMRVMLGIRYLSYAVNNKEMQSKKPSNHKF